jgi:hypothetical protein
MYMTSFKKIAEGFTVTFLTMISRAHSHALVGAFIRDM